MTATTTPQVTSLSEGIVYAVSRLVDDWQNPREPTHSDLSFLMQRSGLATADPEGRVGKEKRVRHVLSWALEHDEAAGERFVVSLLDQIRASGGFRPESKNFVGEDAIANAREAFATVGYELMRNGELHRKLLPSLDSPETPTVLRQYVRRASRGLADAALVLGTGKDLLEATASYVLIAKYGSYDDQANFPTLLGQAFTELAMATPESPNQPDEPAWRLVERRLFDVGCAVNRLRNKEGTGHGRPFLPSVSDEEARVAIQVMGTIAQLFLDRLRSYA